MRNFKIEKLIIFKFLLPINLLKVFLTSSVTRHVWNHPSPMGETDCMLNEQFYKLEIQHMNISKAISQEGQR